MISATVDRYIASAKGLPFFYVVGDEEYLQVLGELKQRGFIVDKASDFCPKDDKVPNIDEIIDHFRTLDVDCHKNRRVLIGMGEYLALKGSSFVIKELQRLKTTTLGSARVIMLLRGITPYVNALVREDNRIVAQQRVHINDNTICSLSLTTTSYGMLERAQNGIKGFLQACEDGFTGNCCVNTILSFPQSIFPISAIDTAYAALRHTVKSFGFKEELGTENQWGWLYRELAKDNFSMQRLYSHYGFSMDFDNELHKNSAGFEMKNWLYFLYLKSIQDSIGNVYLRRVVGATMNYEDLRKKILTEIIRISRTDDDFLDQYTARKHLIRHFPEADIAIFIHENAVDPNESIYRFTDNTQLEKEGIIRWVSRHGYIQEIEYIYPALAQYMSTYIFSCGKLSKELTSYFSEYKAQKLTNCIHPEFLERVIENAHTLKYTHLETRDSALLRIADKASAFLYWIDALGVEYLSYITHLARARGLTVNVDITYAELPTITSINRGFFEQWSGPQKFKEDELDDIKHKEKGGFVFKDGEAPIHLAAELKVIERAIDRAATELALHTCKSFVITSDHGASRLAVIHKQEEKYATDTAGEHSGRCCKAFGNADLPNAIEENGYLILGDYGRFKGSRAANVEVHGGASLEEVLVPVITLSLRKSEAVSIRILHEDSIFADRRAGTTVEVYISDVENPENVSLVIWDSRYPAYSKDASHYGVTLKDVKRARNNVTASVYDSDDLIGSVTFDIKSKTAIENTDFDELF